jgi:membrane-associated protease RseP (regulator of RpoE activity)
MNSRIAILALIALPLGGCVSITAGGRDGDENVLVDRVESDGAHVVYRIRAGGGDEPPKLVRDRHVTVHKIELHVTVGDITKERATKLGVEAWKGVYVESVGTDSNLAKGGLKKGDVLLAINGNAFTNARQFTELGADKLEGATALKLDILRPEGGPQPSWTPISLDIPADAKEVRDTIRDTMKLTAAQKLERSTGMRVAELTAEQASEVFGNGGSRLVICNVRPGSPAYLAGFRAKDRIEKVEGKAVDSGSDVDAIVDAKLNAGTPAAIAVDVEGPLGAYAATVDVRKRLDQRSEFSFPILWCYESDTDELEWGCLQCIFLFGGKYERSYLNSSTRQVALHSDLELLPLGIFELERDPDESRIEFLWFITHKWSND